MRKTRSVLPALLMLGATACAAAVPTGVDLQSLLNAEFFLGGERSDEPRYYEMETRVITLAPEGQPAETFTHGMRMSAALRPNDDTVDAVYTVRGVTIKRSDGVPVPIGSLAGWTYPFTLYPADTTTPRPPLGIAYDPFIGLADDNGNTLAANEQYMLYNMFIDFHGMCDLLGRPSEEGKGIQDLRRMGDRIVHVAAFTEAPISLGDVIADGSTFTNGEITLELRALTLVDGVVCAVIGFDSGESSFSMRMRPAPGVELDVVGRSHYFGELFVELDTRWVRRVRLAEVVSTRVSSGGQILDTSSQERTLTIDAIAPH